MKDLEVGGGEREPGDLSIGLVFLVNFTESIGGRVMLPVLSL